MPKDYTELKEYYVTEFDKIKETKEVYKGKWNWAAFWFGPIWAISKGLLLSGLIMLILCIITSGVLTIPIAVIYAVRGNYIYYCLLNHDKQTLI